MKENKDCWLKFKALEQEFDGIGCAMRIFRAWQGAETELLEARISETSRPPLDTVISLHQVHSDKVFSLDNTQKLAHFMTGAQKEGDGLITNLLRIGLRIKIADCVPVLIYDPTRQVLAVVHSGWKGTYNDIAGQALAYAKRVFQVAPRNVKIFLGPHICKQHYRVDAARKKYFPELDEEKDDEELYLLDLKAAIRYKLINRGCNDENIYDSGLCTYEYDFLESYRRDGANALRMEFIAWII